MGKKNKIRKISDDETKIINAIQNAVHACTSKYNFIRSVQFKEEPVEDDLRFVACLDCGAFEQRILYYPMMFFSEHFIDCEFSFEGSTYVYTFYDVFNLFDIDDFNLYFYGNLLSVDEAQKAVFEILAATEKHLYYIEKTAAPEHLPQLEANYEADMTAISGRDILRDEVYDPSFLALNHPILSFANGEITKKVHKKLKKKAADNKLDTLYEKRLLKYLESGHSVERKSIAAKQSFENVYAKKSLILAAVIFLIAFAVSFTASTIIHAAIFKDALLCNNEWSMFGRQTPIPQSRIAMCLITAVLLTTAVLSPFGKKLLIKIMPDEMKSSAAGKYDKDYADKHGRFTKLAKFSKWVLSAFCIIIAIGTFFASFDDVGFYDDYLKCTSEFFVVNEMRYDDLRIYRIEGYEGNGGYTLYEENYYMIADSNGKVYSVGEVSENGEIDKKLKEISQQYGIEIIWLKTEYELYG